MGPRARAHEENIARARLARGELAGRPLSVTDWAHEAALGALRTDVHRGRACVRSDVGLRRTRAVPAQAQRALRLVSGY